MSDDREKIREQLVKGINNLSGIGWGKFKKLIEGFLDREQSLTEKIKELEDKYNKYLESPRNEQLQQENEKLKKLLGDFVEPYKYFDEHKILQQENEKLKAEIKELKEKLAITK